MELCKSLIKQYVYNLLLAFDQFLSTAILFGDPDSSISSRLGKATLSKKAKWFVKPAQVFVDWLLSPWEKDHCVNAYEPTESDEKELWSWIKKE
jgi:hypothetical protein